MKNVEADLSDLMTFAAAGRAVGMGRRKVEKIALQSGIAVEWGGGDQRRQLRVKLSELKAAILSRRFRQPKKSVPIERRRPHLERKPLDPLVRC
jgi:hypothetical protein